MRLGLGEGCDEIPQVPCPARASACRMVVPQARGVRRARMRGFVVPSPTPMISTTGVLR